ncbi:MAG: M24 family metallopeptidase [Rhizobiales bacterium]|nr:M24 family metallopeptidase [Hyphomicrobiales bacterium]
MTGVQMRSKGEMQGSPTEERALNPLPRSELERRWAATRAYMREAGVDALVVGGTSASANGHLRWFTGIPYLGGNSRTAIFPIEGLMTMVEHGDTDGVSRSNGNSPGGPGVGLRLATPAHMFSVDYTGGHEADLLAREIKAAKYVTIGFVHPGGMYHGVAGPLETALDGVRIINATDGIDHLIAVKSEVEIGLVRAAASMQDDIIAKLREFIRPGLRDADIVAYAEYLGKVAGSSDGTFLASSSPAGQPAPLRPRHQHARTLRAGDAFTILVENNGPGAYFAEIMRTFVLGKAPQELKDGFALMCEAQHNTMRHVRPGARGADIMAAHNAFMRAYGLAEERRLHCHGQGYALVQRPLARPDETMTIAANMNVTAHPWFDNGRIFATVCDNFLIGPDGPSERLHRTPQEIFEL